MKQKTRFSALAAGVVSMGIMLGAGAAQAFTVLCGATELRISITKLQQGYQ